MCPPSLVIFPSVGKNIFFDYLLNRRDHQGSARDLEIPSSPLSGRDDFFQFNDCKDADNIRNIQNGIPSIPRHFSFYYSL